MDSARPFDVNEFSREQEAVNRSGRQEQRADLGIIGDDCLALQFTELHANDIRYTALLGLWHTWDGTRWRQDETLAVFDKARHLCRSIEHQKANALTDSEKKRLQDRKTSGAVEWLSRSDRRVAMTVGQWDADPMVLATPDGTVDLRTGDIRPARREEYATKCTAVAPDFEAECPLWIGFLNRVTDGDVEVIQYLQRLTGYAITGITREHILAFLHGGGANGKGTFLNTVTGIMGDYATVAPANMFEATHGDRHPTELAMLRGARLVAAQETEEGRRWAEARIKALTGGDPITARHMRQDFFTYQPQFTLLIAGNHKPGLRSVDEAIRRRLHLVPFTVQIPERERDPELFEKMQGEWPAILAWMIRGCLEWQRIGLAAPTIVRDATDEYLSSCDAFSQWLEDKTVRTNQYAWESNADLFASWKVWAEAAGEPVGNHRGFADRMKRAGIEDKREAGGNRTRGYVGISLDRQNYSDCARYGG